MKYDHLFITGALTGVDYCEAHQDEAFAVNGIGPGRIAEISARKGAHVTYISTDMVFDGSKEAAYHEADKPNPLSVYGASKLEGEARVLGASRHHLVARASWIFGPNRPAFPEWIIGKACEEARLQLPENKIGCPTYTLDMVRWLAALVLAPVAGPAAGVFHLCNASPCNWREWGQYTIDTARVAGFPVIARKIEGVPVDSVTAFIAKRPLNSAMNTGKFSSLTGIQPRDWRLALRDFVLQIDSLTRYKSRAAVS
jgi:dTDP-4-dehydrorhamnose reductase